MNKIAFIIFLLGWQEFHRRQRSFVCFNKGKLATKKTIKFVPLLPLLKNNEP